MLPLLDEESFSRRGEYDRIPEEHPVTHGPYSVLLVGDFIGPSKEKFDEAYGVSGRFLVRVIKSLFIGGSFGYARMKTEDTKGLIEGELLRYMALFWAEYRLAFGKTTWSPSVDFGLGPGWFAAEPVPLSERRKEIESPTCKLRVSDISTKVLMIAAQLRVPVIRSTDLSISEGNADIILGIGGEFGKGTARYTITDFGSDQKISSRGTVILDAFHAFAGLSFRF
jgi:hypothetical protein